MTVKAFLKEKIEAETLLYYRSINDVDRETIDQIINRWSDDTLFSEKNRITELGQHFSDLKEKRILDMSAGCGSFVIQGLIQGYKTYGVEPEAWKQELIDLKFQENAYDKSWRSHIKTGIGEDLPYEENFFDVFNSWQTFEHVQDVQLCLNELFRVTKDTGGGIIHCPSYSTFFEGHYRLFWFPMMGDSFFSRTYLKLRKRPLEGLKTFVPINERILKKAASKAGFKVVNVKKEVLYNAAKRKLPILKTSIGKVFLPIIYVLWSIKMSLGRIGKHERSIHLKLTKV